VADRREDWLEALEVLLQSPERRESLAAVGRKHVADHFDIAAVTSQLVNFYKEIRKG
jgi:glycosyltransferase involved in cell wall biosynthesis